MYGCELLGRSKQAYYKKQKRGGKGRINFRMTQKSGCVVGMCIVRPDDELFLFSAKGYVLCMDADELGKRTRFARGVIAMKLHEGMPKAVSALLRLHYQEGLTYEELAKLTGVSRMTIRRQMGTAHKMMNEELRTKKQNEI